MSVISLDKWPVVEGRFKVRCHDKKPTRSILLVHGFDFLRGTRVFTKYLLLNVYGLAGQFGQSTRSELLKEQAVEYGESDDEFEQLWQFAQPFEFMELPPAAGAESRCKHEPSQRMSG